MPGMETIVIVLLLLISGASVICVVRLTKLKTPEPDDRLSEIRYQLQSLPAEIGRIEYSVETEIAINRNESAESAKTGRLEQLSSLKAFGELISGAMKESSALQKSQLDTFSANLSTLTRSIEEKLSQ